jgi:hypothetical protein
VNGKFPTFAALSETKITFHLLAFKNELLPEDGFPTQAIIISLLIEKKIKSRPHRMAIVGKHKLL